MYIQRLDIENIRSFQNAHLVFSKGINLIVGANNSGKTTILRCIQNLQNGITGITKDDVRKLSPSGKIHIQLNEISVDEKRIFQPKDIPSEIAIKDQQNVRFDFSNHRGITTEDKFQINPGNRHLLLSNEGTIQYPFQNLDERDNLKLSFPGFPNMEDDDNFIYPFLAKRKTSHYNGKGGRQTAYGVTDGLYNLPSRIQNLTNGTHPFEEDYKKHCKDILGFTVGKIPNAQSDDDKLGIFVQQHTTIPLESMGEGVANILGLLTILLTEDNKLFLIEEIENDIHPEALKKLLQLIIEKSNSNQFIISTHSNIVLKYLASIEATKIFYTSWSILKATTGKRESLPTSMIESIENIPAKRLEILEKLGYDLLDFDLYKSYLLLEESSAERIIRDFLIPQFVPSLQMTLKTIAAGGVTDVSPRFYDFLRLFVYVHTTPIYHKKAWVITDGDPAGQTCINDLNDKFKGWEGHFLHFSKHHFEEYYPEQFRNRFLEINKQYNGKIKQDKKAELLKDVFQWIQTDITSAKTIFETTAKEVIDYLKQIEASLKG